MASRKSHSPKEGSSAWRKQPPDGLSPDLFTKMSKKIAQLTKVIFTLNTRVEDQEALIQAMKEFHEESMQKIIADAKEKIAQCQTKVRREVDLLQQLGQLESELLQEREDRTRLELDMQMLRQRIATAPPANCNGVCVSRNQQLVALYQDVRAAGDAFRRKVDDFELLHMKMMLALENGYQNGDNSVVPSSNALVKSDYESKTLAASYEAEWGHVAKKNEFLREQCDRLFDENSKIRREFEGKLAELKSFYEDSLLKIQGSHKLELANDYSLACCDKQDAAGKTYEKLNLNFRRRVDDLLLQLSKSEQEVERYSKEMKFLCEELQKREKTLKVMDDQVNCGKEEQQKLVSRLKQSEAALTQIKSSCSQQKQELMNKTDKISMLEATKSEQEAAIYRLQTELVSLKEKLRGIAVLKEDCARLQAQVREHEASNAALKAAHEREVAGKDSKLEGVERMLQTYKEESRCLKAIQEQLKAALQEAHEKNEELSKQLKERMDIQAAEGILAKALRQEVKTLKIQLKNTIEEQESFLQVTLKDFKRKENALNRTWEEKLSRELAKERELLTINGEQERDRAVDTVTAEKDASIRALELSWTEKYQSLHAELTCVKAELEQTTKMVRNLECDLDSKAARWSAEKEQLDRELLRATAEYEKKLEDIASKHSNTMAAAVHEKEALIENLKQQHRRELELQAAYFAETTEKQKHEADARHNEEKAKLIQQQVEQLAELEKRLNEEHELVKATICQSYKSETQKLKAELEKVLQQVRSQESAFAGTEKVLQQRIMAQSSDIKQLEASSDKYQSELGAVTKELELKRDEILRVRTEATQQIKLNRNPKHTPVDEPLPTYQTIEMSTAVHSTDAESSGAHVTASSNSYMASALCSPRLLKRAVNFSESSYRSLLPRRPSLPATNAPHDSIASRSPVPRPCAQIPSYVPTRSLETASSPVTSPELLRRLRSPETPSRIASLERSPDLHRKRSVWFSDGPRPSTSVEPSKVDSSKKNSRDHDARNNKDGAHTQDDNRSSGYNIQRMLGDTFRRMKSHKREENGTTDVEVRKNGSRFCAALSKSPRFTRRTGFGTIREADETAPDK
ncbi:protein FAM184A-like isoform X2 [Ornithodoros turicata]|uniref:protein FAM184A-like isoform X2 n=1 Tax=Ornithodoros turicata TaxID=34597 RepID=UPI0031397BE0